MTAENAWITNAGRLANRPGLPPLAPDRVWDTALEADISALREADLDAAQAPGGLEQAQALKAALHLWNDGLDAAHELVQDLPTDAGAALHGIMHRREKDFGNAKYWFHLAGEPAVYADVQAEAVRLLEAAELPEGPLRKRLHALAGLGAWNPYLFTDAAQTAWSGHLGDAAAVGLLERLQHAELKSWVRDLARRLSIGID